MYQAVLNFFVFPLYYVFLVFRHMILVMEPLCDVEKVAAL